MEAPVVKYASQNYHIHRRQHPVAGNLSCYDASRSVLRQPHLYAEAPSSPVEGTRDLVGEIGYSRSGAFMEDLQAEIAHVRVPGMEKAAAIWEALVNLSNPIPPVDIYKAAAAMKCAEFAKAARKHKDFAALLTIITQFFDDTMVILGAEAGDPYQGARALHLISTIMPLTAEIENDPIAYAQRQHTFEGLLLLSAAPLGKEADIKKCYDVLHEATTKIIVKAYGINPDAPAQA
jgi:hypothetical protein